MPPCSGQRSSSSEEEEEEEESSKGQQEEEEENYLDIPWITPAENCDFLFIGKNSPLKSDQETLPFYPLLKGFSEPCEMGERG
ncbi:hypothetical protein NPIL_241681 [Nephila pilipes]|uniref:Uncharacterized protein n=1 Tax=Nephila pilipes TaxID=299642 RepID=A0A8X6PBH7_NEPPI|nr:hypothetical protein NPIL_241681 [Nephila pilipes]